MKYCPYCGADLPGSTVSLCSECGKSLHSKNKKSKGKKQKNKTILQATDKPVLNESRPIEEKQDLTNINYYEGYDGYYDDILPADENIEQQGLDKTVVKNLIFIAIGLIITISACVAAMYLM